MVETFKTWDYKFENHHDVCKISEKKPNRAISIDKNNEITIFFN